jgi:hypothetical protein
LSQAISLFSILCLCSDVMIVMFFCCEFCY